MGYDFKENINPWTNKQMSTTYIELPIHSYIHFFGINAIKSKSEKIISLNC